jgi:hypothetical protein
VCTASPGVSTSRRRNPGTRLAPDLVEAILAGKSDQALMLEELERPLPASWEEQQRLLAG